MQPLVMTETIVVSYIQVPSVQDMLYFKHIM